MFRWFSTIRISYRISIRPWMSFISYLGKLMNQKFTLTFLTNFSKKLCHYLPAPILSMRVLVDYIHHLFDVLIVLFGDVLFLGEITETVHEGWPEWWWICWSNYWLEYKPRPSVLPITWHRKSLWFRIGYDPTLQRKGDHFNNLKTH